MPAGEEIATDRFCISPFPSYLYALLKSILK